MTTETRLTPDLRLLKVQDVLQDTIETLIHLGVQVHDFTATSESKEGLSNQINKLVSYLKALATSDTLNGISIPIDVIQYIEDGRNPDIYTREFVEVVRKVNQFLNGKSHGFSQFQSILGSQIIKEFPDLKSQVDLITSNTDLSNVNTYKSLK